VSFLGKLSTDRNGLGTGTKPGNEADVILRTASGRRTDLVMMITAGRDGLIEGLRGSTDERVVRETPYAVANLFEGFMLG
jgi:nucleotide-binding universal stress UspA family protein